MQSELGPQTLHGNCCPPSQRQSTVYDGGDWFAYPARFPRTTSSFSWLRQAPTRPPRSYDNYVIQSRPTASSNDFVDLLFRDPTAPASFWSNAPLTYRAEGTGLVTARADWNYNSTWMSFQLGNLLGADHQTYSPGQLEIQRGGDGLLINAPVYGDYQSAYYGRASSRISS